MVVNEQSSVLNDSSLIQKPIADAITANATTSDNATTNTTTAQSTDVKSTQIDSWSLSYSLDNDLKTKGSDINISFHEATQGVTYTQYTSISLLQQEDILKEIQSKLLYIKNKDTSDSEREAIRKSIISKLNDLDKIATNSNYNQMYYLQESSSNTDTSTIHSFRVSQIPAVTLNSESIQSNSIGFNLTDLKNIAQDKMSYSVAYAQADIIDLALSTMKEFKTEYSNLQKTFKTSMSNLSNTYENLKSSDNSLKNIDYSMDSIHFDKSSILKQAGNLLQSQAKAKQSTVVDLLKY
jgi:flagellin